jgi:hypothetical protein
VNSAHWVLWVVLLPKQLEVYCPELYFPMALPFLLMGQLLVLMGQLLLALVLLRFQGALLPPLEQALLMLPELRLIRLHKRLAAVVCHFALPDAPHRVHRCAA